MQIIAYTIEIALVDYVLLSTKNITTIFWLIPISIISGYINLQLSQVNDRPGLVKNWLKTSVLIPVISLVSVLIWTNFILPLVGEALNGDAISWGNTLIPIFMAIFLIPHGLLALLGAYIAYKKKLQSTNSQIV